MAIDRVEPSLRSRVVDALDQRFDSRVELDRFHVSVLRGFEAEGAGLRLYPRRSLAARPLIAIARFRFRISWTGLLRNPMRVGRVAVEGMAIDVPSKEQRLAPSSPSRPVELPTAPLESQDARGTRIIVDEVSIQNARLLIGTSKPGKLPLDFEIARVHLYNVGPGRPMKFDATLINPRPVGNIESSGYFGPFDQHDPGLSPVWGAYTFSHANLATFKGIAGVLSSAGKYQGPLDRIAVDGRADVPDFRLSTGNHPMPLHTVFHAIVDGTSGDTCLQPVEAQLGRSRFIVTGAVVKVPPTAKALLLAAGPPTGPHGHEITLNMVMNHARIEDFLKLAVRTDPPVMNGALRLAAHIFIPPGDLPITEKLHLQGNFEIEGASFSNQKIQHRIDELSSYGLGHPRDPELRQDPPQPEADAPSALKGDFTLASARLDFPALDFSVPGADIDLAGVYTLDGRQFDFHGHAKLLARPSQMTTGWKSLLLKTIDPLLARQGYGTVVPIEVSGAQSDPRVGLDFGHKAPKPSPPFPK